MFRSQYVQVRFENSQSMYGKSKTQIFTIRRTEYSVKNVNCGARNRIYSQNSINHMVNALEKSYGTIIQYEQISIAKNRLIVSF